MTRFIEAATQKLDQETGRKALIILTDGEDEGSDHKIRDAIARSGEKQCDRLRDPDVPTGRMYWSQGEGYYGYSPGKADLR